MRDHLPISRRAAIAGACGVAWGAGAARVRLGACEPAANFAQAVRLGFDYYEPEAAEIAAMSAERFARFRAEVLASPIRCYAIRSFVRAHKVVGEAVPWDTLAPYLETTTARCAELGARVIVFGSGGARRIPDGFSRERAWDQLCEFLRRAGNVARQHGIVIGIEPLRRAESNVINSVAEAAKLARDCGHPNVRIIVDFFHLRQEGETPEAMWSARKQIVHLHFANPAGRVWPKQAGEDAEYASFFRMLQRMRYRGGLTIEAPNGRMERDGAESLRFFRAMLAAGG